MGVPPLPRDPHDPHQTQPGQPAGQQPYPGPMPPPPQMQQQQQIVYVQTGPGPLPGRRGMTKTGHGFNWTLTIFTCGMWLPMYGCWWATVKCVQAWRNHQERKRYNQTFR